VWRCKIAIEEKPLPDHTYIIAPTTVQAKVRSTMHPDWQRARARE